MLVTGLPPPKPASSSDFRSLRLGTCQLGEKKFQGGLFFSSDQCSFEKEQFARAELCPKTPFQPFSAPLFPSHPRFVAFRSHGRTARAGKNLLAPPSDVLAPRKPRSASVGCGARPRLAKSFDITGIGGSEAAARRENTQGSRAGLPSHQKMTVAEELRPAQQKKERLAFMRLVQYPEKVPNSSEEEL